MSGTLTMGDRGRIVIPIELREERGWTAGTALIAIDTPDGLLLTDRDHALEVIRRQLAGHDLVAELIAERRAAAAAENAE